MSKFHKRERRYAARALEIKQHIHGQLIGWELTERLAEFLPMSNQHRFQLHHEMCRLIDNPDAFIPVMPCISIIAIPFFEIDLAKIIIWESARYQLIDGPVLYTQPAWRRIKKGRKT
ncbi:hypothetical protein [Pseudogulbenkiania subflava]|uniref:Uncharacterized protein n=1 Tax=Pseudogulbenkiania subflava DSM 22618 TaxID=1123014 RepID=A0A1Y6C117_9NEIS|nr:hypothetical protein [Pseudogulbenkiania subflava]SMF39947.1 hypothetical protein SAMN02745746_03007 [Pseudogulbenkiania subflava DSM 22618]